MTDSNKWRKPKPKEASTRRGGKRKGSGGKNRERIEAEVAEPAANDAAEPVADAAANDAEVSKRTARFKNMSLRERFPLMPLEFMLSVVNEIDPKTGEPRHYLLEDQLAAARASAPFIHPKLSNVDLKARQKYSVDIDKLSDDELVEFERLLLKCQVPKGQQTTEDIAAEVIDGDYEVTTGPGGTKGGGGTTH